MTNQPQGIHVHVSVNKDRVSVSAWLETPAKVDELIRMLQYAKTQLADEQAKT